jgi:hypothetical protein
VRVCLRRSHAPVQAMSVVFVMLCLGGELKIFVVRTHKFFLSVRPG